MKTVKTVAVASLVASAATAAGDAGAAVDAFLKIEGIEGDSTVKGEEHAIEIRSFEFSATSSASLGSATGGLASGKRTFSPIVIQKPVDSASVALFKAFLQGEGAIRGPVEIDFVKTVGDTAVTYLKFDLGNVLVSSYAISTSADRPTESISLNFTKIQETFIPQNPRGTAGTPVSTGFDLANIKVQ
jgi:type VI secretion system secreted protein Hcp